MKKKSYPAALSALPETNALVRKISEATGMKKYVIVAEAVNLWAKQNGYAK
jgi:hypothetical protein